MNAPEPGFLTGEIAGDGTTGNLVCMADANVRSQGSRMLTCVGQSPGDNARMLNLFMVSAD